MFLDYFALIAMIIVFLILVYAAIYSENWRPVAIVRRILLRMKSWQKFVFIGG